MKNLAPNKKPRKTTHRVVSWILAILAALCGVLMGAGVVFGQTSVADSLYSIALNITNTTATQKDDIQVPFTLSTASLIDDGFITSDALNSAIQRGAIDVPAMPGTNRILVKGAAQDDGGVFTNYTSEAQNATGSDVVLLPAAPTTNDAFYFGFDIPAGMSTVDIDVAGVGTWAVTWEYYNGSSWAALSDVDDRTSAFSILGRNIVTWTVPADWSTTTVVSTSAYWVRARVSSISSITTQPLASLIQYETGEWWSWVETLPVNTQEQYTLYMGGPAMQTYHELFTGASGISVDDAVALEPGSQFAIAIQGRIHFDTFGGTACYVCKSDALSIRTSADRQITATVTGAGSAKTLSVSSITVPDTGSNNVILASDGTNMALWVDGGGGLDASAAESTLDNASAWTWASSNALDYSDHITYDIGAVSELKIFRTDSTWNTGTASNTTPYDGALGLGNQ
jgi:hypothetical protein